MDDEDKLIDKKDWWKIIIIFALCLMFTLFSFAIFYIFKPLDTKWLILICIVDVLFSIILTCLFIYDKRDKFGLKHLGISLLFLGIYFIIFNTIGLFILWQLSGNYFILYWQECICFSLFIMPCYYIVIPILLFVGEAVSS